MKKIVLNIITLFLVFAGFSQNLPILDPFSIRNYEKESLVDNKFHSSIKSYYFSDFQNSILDREKALVFYKHNFKNAKEKTQFYISPEFDIANFLAPSDNKVYGINPSLGALLEFSYADKLGISYNFNAWYISKMPSYTFKTLGNSTIYHGLGKNILENQNYFLRII